MRCSACGAGGSGNYCSACGAPFATEPSHCPHCGGELKAGALYCSACGRPAGSSVRKPVSAHLPWVLSFVILASFSLAIAYFVQRQSRARVGDDPITGGLPEAPAPAPGEGGAMPDLGSMMPREAADRLFDRSMQELESGNEEQARFFATMGLQAYGRVPPGDLDVDALFHVGLLHLAIGDAPTARTIADGILAENEDHLLALLLARRAAAATGDEAAAEGFAARLRAAVEAGRLDERPEYEAHRSLLEREAGVMLEEGSS